MIGDDVKQTLQNVEDFYKKISINVDKYCFPSIHGEDIEQNTHNNASSPYIIKLHEFKAFLPQQ